MVKKKKLLRLLKRLLLKPLLRWKLRLLKLHPLKLHPLKLHRLTLLRLLTLLLRLLLLPSNSGSRNEKPAFGPVFFRLRFAAAHVLSA